MGPDSVLHSLSTFAQMVFPGDFIALFPHPVTRIARYGSSRYCLFSGACNLSLLFLFRALEISFCSMLSRFGKAQSVLCSPGGSSVDCQGYLDAGALLFSARTILRQSASYSFAASKPILVKPFRPDARTVGGSRAGRCIQMRPGPIAISHSPHPFTTIFTSLPGTTMTFTTSFPSV